MSLARTGQPGLGPAGPTAPAPLPTGGRDLVVDTCVRMAWYLDQRRWDDFGALFDDETALDYTELFGGEPSVVGPADMAHRAEQLLSGLVATQHLVASHLVEGSGDDARCWSMVQATHRGPPHLGDLTWTVGGQYHMALRRRSGRWRITGLRLVVSWTSGHRAVLRLARGGQ